MKMIKTLLYDIEIKKAILGRNETPIEGIEYAEKGWDDNTLGISVLCAYSYPHDRYYIFADDNLAVFHALIHEHELMVGFNINSFDDRHLKIAGFDEIADKPHYDILVEMWKSAGLGEKFVYPIHAGFGLDATLVANLPGYHKSGHGAIAPILYQEKRLGELHSYCLDDIRLEKNLFDLILRDGQLKDPRNPKSILILKNPLGHQTRSKKISARTLRK